jgi:hypothetical protein
MSDTSEEISTLTLDAIDQTRRMSIDSLLQLNQLQKLNITLLEQELKRIRKTSEETDPHISMLIEKIESSKSAVNLINIQLEVEEIKVPKISTNQILIHGRVTDEDYHGIKDLVVSLAIGKKAFDVVGRTDKSGYYSIILSSSILQKRKDGGEIFAFVHYGDILLHMSSGPLELDEQETKYEIVLSNKELDIINQQKKSKTDVRRDRKK